MKSFIVENITLAGVLLACNVTPACEATHPDGDRPVMAEELDGKWCDARPARLLCFEAYGGAYAWLGADCFEAGLLFGGLEFSPHAKHIASANRCFGEGELYSASVDWSDKGLVLYIDGQDQPLSLTYVRR